jgi:peptidoglycan/LPS O-acetylase OafA/YrhL
MGAMVALAVANGASRRTLVRRAVALLAVAGAAVAVVCVKSGGPYPHAPRVATYGYTAFDAVFAALLMLVVAGQPRGWGVLRSRALRVVGTHSYAIYLVHVPITFLGIEVFRTEAVRAVLLPPSQALGSFAPLVVAYFAFVVGLSLLVARVTWVLVERPFLRLKDRFPMREAAGQSHARRGPSASTERPMP